jgi:mucin-19
MSKMTVRGRSSLVLAAWCALGGAAVARGQTFTWDGGGVNNFYTVATNWSADTVPANLVSDIIVFSGAVRPSPQLNTARQARRVTFQGTTGFNLTGSGVNYDLFPNVADNVIDVASAFPVSILPNIRVNTASSVIRANFGDLTLAGQVRNVGGAGLTSLAAAGRTITYSGTLTVEGPLQVSGTHVLSGVTQDSGGFISIIAGQTTKGGTGLLPDTYLSGGSTLVMLGSGQMGGLLTITNATLDLTTSTQTVGPSGLSLSSATVDRSSTSATLAATGSVSVAGFSTINSGFSATQPVAIAQSGTLSLVGGISGSVFRVTGLEDCVFQMDATPGVANLVEFQGDLDLVLDVGPTTAAGTITFSGNQLLDNTLVNNLFTDLRGRMDVLSGTLTCIDDMQAPRLDVRAGAAASIVQSLSVGALNNAGTILFSTNGALPRAVGQATNSGTFSVASAAIATGVITNTAAGSINLTAATLGASIVNSGLVSVNTSSTVGAYTHLSGGALTIAAGQTLTHTGAFLVSAPLSLGATEVRGTGTSTFTNDSVLTLAGVVLSAGSGGFENLRVVNGSGTLAAGSFRNSGTWTVGENLVLTGTASFTNAAGGNLVVPAGAEFAGVVRNSARVTMAGGRIDANSFNNALVGQVFGHGTLDVLALDNSGEIVASGGVLFAFGNVNNIGGTIRLGTDGSLNVASITNGSGGLITGAGSINGPINTIGGSRIDPTGTLILVSPLTSGVGSEITLRSGATLRASLGLASDTHRGFLNLLGGQLDTLTRAVTNSLTGRISGYGSLLGEGLRNQSAGQVALAGGTSIVGMPVTNDLGGVFRVDAATAIFTRFVTNNGTFLVGPGGFAVFTGGSSGTPSSPPADESALAGTGTTTLGPGAFAQTDGIAQAGLVFNGSLAAPAFMQVTSRQPGGVIAPTGRTTGQSVSVLGAVSIASNGAALGSRVYFGAMDLADNDLIIRNGNLALIRDWVRAGLAGGNGLYSSASGSGGVNDLATLAVRTPDSGSGFPEFVGFDGVSVAIGDVVVKYTYRGDTNLDGKVDVTDFNAVLNGFTNNLTGWHNGDSNYDGVVNAVDFAMMLDAYAGQGAPFSDTGVPGGSIPEPTALIPLAFLGGLLRRGRR